MRQAALHTHTQPFNGLLSGTTRVGRYQKKHSPTHTHPDHRTSIHGILFVQAALLSYAKTEEKHAHDRVVTFHHSTNFGCKLKIQLIVLLAICRQTVLSQRSARLGKMVQSSNGKTPLTAVRRKRQYRGRHKVQSRIIYFISR